MLNPVFPAPKAQAQRPRNVADIILHARDAAHARALLYEWQQAQSRSGKPVWVNSETKQRRYQTNKPGEGRKKKEPTESGGKNPTPKPAGEKKPRQPRAPKVDHNAVGDKIQAMLDKPHEIGDDHISELRAHLGGMTVAQLGELRKRFGVRGGGRKKADQAEGLHGHVAGKRGQGGDQPTAPARTNSAFPGARKPPIRFTQDDLVDPEDETPASEPAPADDREARIQGHAERIAREQAGQKKSRKPRRQKPAPTPEPVKPDTPRKVGGLSAVAVGASVGQERDLPRPDIATPRPGDLRRTGGKLAEANAMPRTGAGGRVKPRDLPRRETTSPGSPVHEVPVVPTAPDPTQQPAPVPRAEGGGSARSKRLLTGALTPPGALNREEARTGRRGKQRQHARQSPEGVELDDTAPVGILTYARNARTARPLLYAWLRKRSRSGGTVWVNDANPRDRRYQDNQPGANRHAGNLAVSPEEHLRRVLEAGYDVADRDLEQLQQRLRKLKPAALIAMQRVLEG